MRTLGLIIAGMFFGVALLGLWDVAVCMYRAIARGQR